MSPAQKQALIDTEYLVQQLPKLAKGTGFRSTRPTVANYLQMLMYNPNYQFREDHCLPKTTVHTQVMAPSSQAFLQSQHAHYHLKRQACLTQLEAQTKKPLTTEDWPQVIETLLALEEALLKITAAQPKTETAISEMLGNWFDVLQDSSQSSQTSPLLTEQTLPALASRASSPIASSASVGFFAHSETADSGPQNKESHYRLFSV